MSDANAMLRGMLGMGQGEAPAAAKMVGNQKKDGDKKNKPKGPKPANKTPPKPRKSTDGNQTNTKSARGKRGGGKKNSSTEAGENSKEESASAKPNNNSNANSGKKKRNKKRESQGENEDDEKKTPQLKDSKQYNSDKHNAQVYAWSAFQSSPDPSALPDIGGLFLGGEESKANESEETKKDLESSVNLGSSLNLGPPSDRIRGSLVDSMLNKGNDGANAGEALLAKLTSPTRQSFSNPMPAVHEQFRTAESLEAEMLSPSLKPEKKTDADQSTLPKLNLNAPDEQKSVEKSNEDKRDDNEGGAALPQTTSVSPNPADHSPQPSMKKEYPDAITQLMNPGFGAGGYGMHPHMPNHPQHAPYHFPMHHGPPPPGPGYHAHPYPIPHHHHHHHPYHPMQPNVRPGFTTVQVRVPQSLLPGNTMIVEGMQIQVPPGVPPGAVIPVNIPIPNPQHYYGHPPHHPPNFPGGYPPHMQHHMMHQHMPPPPPPPQQHQNHAPNIASQSNNSWASKVASGPSPQKSENKTKHVDTQTASDFKSDAADNK